tara:strand:- start:1822 stop:2106 length:285 start_codon:yes stop_codon:yes gene_type:complete
MRLYNSCVAVRLFDYIAKNGLSEFIIESYIRPKGFKHIDEIKSYILEQALVDILRSFKIDVSVITEQYNDKNFTRRDFCEQKEIDFKFFCFGKL